MSHHDAIDALQWENRRFPPSPEFQERALVTGTFLYDEAREDDEGFWARQAADLITWSKEWDTICEWELPFAKWFIGGELNVSYNCLDRHVLAGRGDKVAFHFEGEPGDTRTVTYTQLLDETQRFANVLTSLGVVKGDRVNIYLPMIPEAAVAMLACARIGAAHSVVFGGFSATSLSDRINDAEAKVLITADGGHRRGEVFPLKPVADEALASTTTITDVVVVRRGGNDVPMSDGRDHWYHDLMARPTRCAPPSRWTPSSCCSSSTPPAPRAAEGDHAHERGLPHAGRLHAQVRVRPPPETDVYWCTADVGLGHRPQLHRLRPARERCDAGHVRGRAELPRRTTGCGRSSRSTASRSSTPRRPRSGRS
jgi:acetyl-CoA synthetase